jgi:hypothetical protein
MPRACWATLAGCTILGVRRIGIASCLLIKHVAFGPELLDASGWARRQAPAVLVTIEPHQAAHQDNQPLSTTSITSPPTKYQVLYPSVSTTLTAGPSIIFTFLPSHQLISPAAMATPHPRAINVPVAHVGLSSRL